MTTTLWIIVILFFLVFSGYYVMTIESEQKKVNEEYESIEELLMKGEES